MMGIEKRSESPRSDNFFRYRKGLVSEKKNSLDKDEGKQTVHSGQFMLSRVHDTSPALDDDGEGITPSVKEEAFDFGSASKETSKSYTFTTTSQTQKTISIDSTLTKLFECMSLAYSGKLTSPKWKQFRGLQLTVKDKIRLNNLIWREWCMQYIYGKDPIICQFATPLSDDMHSRAEAVVLEGKYWKRRLDTVTYEYKKWRQFYKKENVIKKGHGKRAKDLEEFEMDQAGAHSAEKGFMDFQNVGNSTTDILLNSADFMEMDFTDSLFNQLNQSNFSFPNPKEFSGFGMADLMQPGLIPLQPNLDDNIMDFEELLQTTKMNQQQSLPQVPLFTGSSSNNGAASTSSRGVSDIAMPSFKSSTFPSDPQPSLLTPPVAQLSTTPQPSVSVIGQSDASPSNSAVATLLSLLQTSPQTPDNSAMLADIATLLLDGSPASQTTQLLLQIQQLQQQQRKQQQQQQQQQNLLFQLQQQQQQQKEIQKQQELLKQEQQAALQPTATFFLPSSQTFTLPQQQTVQPTVAGDALSAVMLNTDSNQGMILSSSDSKIQTTGASGVGGNSVGGGAAMSSLQAALLAPPHSKVTQGKASSAPVLSSLSKKLEQSKEATAKKDIFAVPKGKPMGFRSKTRTATAPTPLLPKTSTPTTTLCSVTPSQQNTYLAQLLTTGTYPGAVIKVEKERPAPSITPTTLTPIRPVEPVTSPQPITTTILPQSIGNIAVNLQPMTDFSQNVLITAANPTGTTSATALSDICTVSAEPPTPVPLSVASPETPERCESPLNRATSPTDSYSLDSPRSRHDSGEMKFKDTRRVSHISAEHKRRCNIKNGFDMLHVLIPALSQSPNAKVSKASMLQKTAEYCKKLKSERAQMQNEADILKQEIESLNQAIGQCQSQLPATGVPVTRQRADKMNDMFDEYVKKRTLENWRFWIFSTVIKSLFETFNNMVSTASVEEMCRTSLAWLDQHCSLVALRPTVLNALRNLSTSTSILSDPSRLPEQATEAVIKKQKPSKS